MTKFRPFLSEAKLLADSSSLIRQALTEDLGSRGDVTTRFFMPAKTRLKGRIVAKQAGVLCGVSIAANVFRRCAPGCKISVLLKDGRRVKPGQAVMTVSGGPGLLAAERTALNFLQHLSGIASLTELYVRMVHGLRPCIYDTRKTLPGYRALAKYAVLCGGGRNHRMGLHDAVLVKDNHWAARADLAAAASEARKRYPKMTIEIEAASMGQVRRALQARADIILLDNMSPARLKISIAHIRRMNPRTEIEISGGVNLKTVRALARLNPDRISIGRLTHSAPALDLSLEIE